MQLTKLVSCAIQEKRKIKHNGIQLNVDLKIDLKKKIHK